MKLKLSLILFFIINSFVWAQETYVPDNNFENYLETHDVDGNIVTLGSATSLGNGIANDDYITTSKISNLTSLNISSNMIADITGIEDFTKLMSLDCSDNSLTTLNISNNSALKTLSCFRNNLQSIDVRQNTQLTTIQIFRNQLSTIDLTHNLELTTLSCSNNQLTGINLTNNTKLEQVSIYNNSTLNHLDVTNLPLLKDLDCVNTNLSSLDVSQNPELQYLQAYENQLTSIDITKNVKLIELYIEDNQITSLDISKNVVLEDLSLANNSLTYLNVKNGNNTNLDKRNFDITNNSGLTCVSVDDIAYANTNFTKKDVQTLYNVSCLETYVPDDNFENYLETHNLNGGTVSVGDPTSLGNGVANDNHVGTERIQNVKNLNASNQGITDFTGLEAFNALEELRIFGNTVSSLDLSANTNLLVINCGTMGLTSINVNGLTALKELDLNSNNLTSINVSSNLLLEKLRVTNNQLSSINITVNTALTDLRVQDNNLSLLDISTNVLLDYLSCWNNNLTNLNLQNNVLLENLSCGKNPLTTLDVSMLTKLTDLSIEDTSNLTSLNVTNNLDLEDIGVNNTSLTSLDLSNNTKLVEVYTHTSQITVLDLSNSPNVEYIECYDSLLTSLNLKNGNNSRSIELYATGNPNLSCIQVDDPNASYLSRWEKDVTANFSDDCNWTYTPDDNFENYLETHDANNNVVSVGDVTSMGNGIANDNHVATVNIENVTRLFIANASISDFTGLEDFSNLEELFCFGNVINTSLDLTSLTKLERFQGGDMGLTSVNVTDLTNLYELDVPRNNLTSVNVSTNTALTRLVLSNNDLTGVDVSVNALLEDLQVHETTLTSVDVTNNPLLTRLTVSLNQISSINIENNPLIENLTVSRNPLTDIDVSHLSNLEDISINNTNITSIDFSNNAKLVEVYMDECPNLSYVNVKNGTNAIISDFEVDNNPSLTCIEVDDPSASYLTSWTKDAAANYAQYCRFTYVPDDNFENYLETHKENTGGVPFGDARSLGNGVMDNLVPTEKIENLTILFIEEQSINDFTGLEDFLALERFRAYGNPVNGALDLTANTNLKQIFCWNMGLTSINITGLENLLALAVNENDLDNIDISSNTNLEDFVVYDNNLTSLDVTQNASLIGLNYVDNSITTIDLTQNSNLKFLYCNNNGVTELNLKGTPLIETLELNNNPISSIDVSALANLVNLDFSNTNISSVDVSNNLNLSLLECNDNSLIALDVTNNIALRTLNAQNNSITTLDLGNNINLDALNAANNQLTYINLKSGETDGISTIDITNNPGLTCIEVDDPSANYLNTWSKDVTANFAEYCRFTAIPDANFESYLETHDANGNLVSLGDASSLGNGIIDDNQVPTEKINVVVNLDLNRLDISDLTGIEAFTALESLNVDYNDLTVLDVSNNSNLRILDAAENDITSLDLSTNAALEEVELRSNKIVTLIVNNSNLRKLRASKNSFSYLNLTNCPQLEEVSLTQTLLVTLDISNGNNDQITDFNASYNDYLTCIEIDDASASYLSTWNKDATANFTENCNTAIWTGKNGTNWTDTENWIKDSVALSSQNVVVPVLVTSPIIESGVLAEMNDLKIHDLSSFTIEDNGATTVNGDFETAETAFIKSSVNTSGTLIVKGSSNGTISYERSGLKGNKWSIITAPVSGQSIKEFVENPANEIRINNTVSPNRYAVAYYDDSKPEGSKWTYYTTTDLVDNSILFEEGKAYIISRKTNGSVTFTGNLTTTNKTVNVNGDQWNAVGNPYTAYLPINNNSDNNFIQENLSKFSPAYVAVYVWNNTQNKYVAKTLAGSPTSLTVGQGFFIKTNVDESTIDFKASQRSHDASDVQVFSKENISDTSIQILATSEGISVDTNIKYTSNASINLDPGYDVANFDGATFDIFTGLVAENNEYNFTIQSLPNTNYESMIVPLGIKAAANSKIQLTAVTKNLPEGIEVYIEDKKLNTFTPLNKEYIINVDKAINGTGRFYLHTTTSNVLSTEEIVETNTKVQIFKSNKQSIKVTGLAFGTSASINIHTITGKEIFKSNFKANHTNEFTPSNLAMGVYIVSITTENGIISKKLVFEN